jgi:glycerol kinase
MTDYWLALDQGGHAGRAIAFDRHGRVLTRAAREVATATPAPGHYEQDAEAVVASLEEPLAEVVGELGADNCRGAGLATQRSSIACWDRHTGAALGPIISWRDTRHAAWLDALGLDEPGLRAITGLRASPHYGASKLRWCLDNLPAVQAARADGRLACGPLAGFLIARLTAEHRLLVDPGNAARTLLWDLTARDWSGPLLERFGLQAGWLPRPAPAGKPLGTLRLAPSVGLALATGDQSAALYAAGPPAADQVYINAGTGAFALQLAPWPNDEDRLLTTLVRDDPDQPLFALEGTVNGAGAALDAVARTLGVADWPAAVAGLPATAPAPVYLNGHSGLGSPWWVPRFDSHWLDEGTAPARLLGVLESIVFLLATNVRRLAAHGLPQTGIVLGGGLSRAPAFARRLADLTGLPVRVAPAREATALGLARLVAGGAMTPPAPPEEVTEPQPAAALERRYGRWLEAMTEATGFDPV